jgi:hypothetical protein
MKIFLVGGELLDAVGETDVTKLVVAFRSCSNAPKKGNIYNIAVKYSIEELKI